MDTKTVPWIKAMLEWVRDNRPNEYAMFEQLLTHGPAANSNADALILMAHIGFESGRKFQHDNPNVELGPILE